VVFLRGEGAGKGIEAGDKQYPLSRGLPRAGWRAVGDSTPVILPLLAEETKVGRLGGEGAKELVDEAL